MAVTLSAAQARTMALRAQGLYGRRGELVGAGDVLRRVMALQLDTISVLARSHELVCYARVGPVGRAAVEAACWGRDAEGDPVAVEYWAHAGCILPIELWPWFAFRRRKLARLPRWGGYVHSNPAVDEVRKRLAADGPLTSSDLGGSKNGGPWWDWSPMKVAVERLLDLGEVVCTTRRGWRRVYDLTERVLPARVAALGEPSDEECWRVLTARAGRALGVATVADLAEYFRLPVAGVRAVVADCGLVPVTVDGWAPVASKAGRGASADRAALGGTEPVPGKAGRGASADRAALGGTEPVRGKAGRGDAWVEPGALDAPDTRGRHRTTLVSPFDSLVWDRARTTRLFGYTHRIEAYTPAPQRVHGYYVMPLLAGGRLIGRVDPKRSGRTLVARQVSLTEPFTGQQVAAAAQALREAAEWVGCDAVAVERCQPEGLDGQLRVALDVA